MDDECGGATPFCGPAGECVDCSGMMDPDAACTSANPDLAVCIDGECVECGPGQTSACMAQDLFDRFGRLKNDLLEGITGQFIAALTLWDQCLHKLERNTLETF